MTQLGSSHNSHRKQLIDFFPQNKSSRSKSQDLLGNQRQKLPLLYNKIYNNKSQSRKNGKMHKRNLSSYEVTDFQPSKIKHNTNLYKYLSSKVDFFNEQNQRRLSLSKRKIMIDLGIIHTQKQKVIPNKKIGQVSSSMMQLIHDYLLKRSAAENQNDQYYVLGRQV